MLVAAVLKEEDQDDQQKEQKDQKEEDRLNEENINLHNTGKSYDNWYHK
jgi:hypothetical protein